LPSSITLQDLAAGGYISAKYVRDFGGMDVVFYPTTNNSDPQAILVRLTKPDGVQIGVLADGSIQRLPK